MTQSEISIGGRSMPKLRFADNIDLIAGSESELQSLIEYLEVLYHFVCK